MTTEELEKGAELLKLLVEARSEIVMVQNALRRELDWLERRDLVARIDKVLDAAQDAWLHAEPVDAGWHRAEKGQLVGTVNTHVCLLYVNAIEGGYSWQYHPWRVSGVAKTEEEAKQHALNAALHKEPK